MSDIHLNEARDLIEALCEDELSPEQDARLQALLEQSEDAQWLYIDYLNLHANLSWDASKFSAVLGRPEGIPEQPLQSRVSPPIAPQPVRPPVLGFLGRKTAALNRPVYWSVLAAGVLFAAYFVTVSWNMLGKKLPDSSWHAPSAVAVISDTENAEWPPESRLTAASRHGESIKQGEPLQITSGLVEVKLKQGTTLLVEGPAEWSIDGENNATLKRGKLVAKVPQAAIGFTLDTPTAKIIDLGTEFGVEVNPDGAAAVHVIQGQVTVSPRGAGSEENPQKLRANQSVRVGHDSKLLAIAFDLTPFETVQKVAAKSPDRTPNQISGLRLWLQSDRGVRLDGGGNVECWADQSGHGFDAVQPDPARRPRSTNNQRRSSLQFDGVDDFLECRSNLDFNTGSDSTIFLHVTLPNPPQQEEGIFSLRPRQGEDWTSHDGLAIFQRSTYSQSMLCVLQSRVFHGDTMPLDIKIRHHVNLIQTLLIVLTKEQKTARLRINGRTLVADPFESVPPPESINTTGYLLGARFGAEEGQSVLSCFSKLRLLGVLIYDRAIAGAEIASIESYLRHRAP